MSTEQGGCETLYSQTLPIVHIKKEPIVEPPATIPADFFEDIQKEVKIEKDYQEGQNDDIETSKNALLSILDNSKEDCNDREEKHKVKKKYKKLDDAFIRPLLEDNFRKEMDNLELIGLQETLKEKQAVLKSLEKNLNSGDTERSMAMSTEDYGASFNSEERHHAVTKERYKEKMETPEEIEARRCHKKYKKSKKHRRNEYDVEKSEVKHFEPRPFKRLRPIPVSPIKNEIRILKTEFNSNLLSDAVNGNNDWKFDDILYQEKERYDKFNQKVQIKAPNEHAHSSRLLYRSPDHRAIDRPKSIETNNHYQSKLIKPKVEITLPKESTFNINDLYKSRSTNSGLSRIENNFIKKEVKEEPQSKSMVTLKLDNITVIVTAAQHLGVYNFLNFLCDEENKNKSNREISESLMEIYMKAQT